MRVSKTQLGNLKPLSEGGFGKVYRVAAYHLPSDPTDLAYKEFTTDVAEQAVSAETAVNFRERMSPQAQADLDRYAAWPRALVTDRAGAVIGLLMPLIPADFFFRGPDPLTGQIKDLPCEIVWLFTTAAYRAQAQVNLPDADLLERLIVIGQLVYAVGRLHKLGWVFGDISHKNAVYALQPPRVLLIDCDGAAALSDQGRKQGHTPTWDPPESPLNPPLGQPPRKVLQTEVTDVYKLGLVILRALTQSVQARNPAALAGAGHQLDAAAVALLSRAVAPNPAARPTARELYLSLRQMVAAQAQPPQVQFARIRRLFMLRGEDARIEWQIGNATQATVSAGGKTYQVDLLQHPDGFSFRPDQSGRVTLMVSNRLGSLTFNLGEVTLYELPPVSVNIGSLPTPQFPDLPQLSLASMQPVLDTVPRVRLPEPPSVPDLQTYGLIDTLVTGTALSVELPAFSSAVLEASRAVADLIWADAQQRAEAARPTP